MDSRLASLAAAASSLALLVAAPFGVAAGLALQAGTSPLDAWRTVSLAVELASALAWVLAFAALARLEGRSPSVRRLQSLAVCIVALAAGMLGFYRLDPPAQRAIFSAQYALLVFLAFILFGFVRHWLSPVLRASRRP